jgi:hypothetical protein
MSDEERESEPWLGPEKEPAESEPKEPEQEEDADREEEPWLFGEQEPDGPESEPRSS